MDGARGAPDMTVSRTMLAVAALSASLFAQPQPGQQAPPPSQPARDTSAGPRTAAPAPSGRITGRVVASDNGHPIKRARVLVTAAELPGGRGVLTDDGGVFEIAELPPGRYSVNVSKVGFVALSYGQRRPLQAGTPLQLGDGQQLKGIDFRLPRGSVVAGRLVDEDGEPMPGATVGVMRYQYLQGDRRLVSAGSGQTDDKGQFRVWGLMPGDYYVSAVARNFAFGPGGRGGFGGGRGGFAGRGTSGGGDEESIAYAPTYFPGVESVDQAKAITVGLSQEVLDVNFSMHLVRTARIDGRVVNPDGTPVTAGNVQLLAESARTRGQIGVRYGGRIDWDGTFAIGNVPPGRYVLHARADDAEALEYGAQPVAVTGEDLTDLSVIVSPGATISGKVTFSPTSAPPDYTQVRVVAAAVEQGVEGPAQSRVDKDGTFSIRGVAAGPHLVRPQGQLRGWVLESVTIGGRDTTDTPIDLRAEQALANVVVAFTDKISQITGTLTNVQGAPVVEYTVLAFPTDASLWRPQARQIVTARPDQTGRYTIRGLPPGEYYLVPVDPAEQGEWFEPAYLDAHRSGAIRLTLAEGDAKTHDFKLGS
jgi:hypothetical protein